MTRKAATINVGSRTLLSPCYDTIGVVKRGEENNLNKNLVWNAT